MGIPEATRVRLAVEGISEVDDLGDFDKTALQQLCDNLRRPGGRVQNPDAGAPVGEMIPTPAFTFGAKSQQRISVACDAVRFYRETGRPLTVDNMQWNQVLKNFEVQWKALKSRKEDDEPEVPKITKALPIIKWTEAFKDFLSRVIGSRTIPLSYVTRDDVVPGVAQQLVQHQPYSEEHGSVEGELIARAKHDHPLYRDDNKAVYQYLEEATRSTQYAATLKPFQRAKNGRGAWEAIVLQYAGKDKWEAEIKRQEQLLHTREWKGQSNFSLEHFVSQHRNAYVSMQACAEHVEYQLPNEHSRVGYLLDALKCSDAGLQAAMASVNTNNDGMRNDFEKAASYLLPYDPVAKKRQAGSKRGAGYISAVEGEVSAVSGGSKASIGKTGVHLRYYTTNEYKKLTNEQKDELREWRANNPEDASAKQKRRKKQQKANKKSVSFLVAKEVAALKAKDKSVKDDQEVAFIASVVKEAMVAMEKVKIDEEAANVSSVRAANEVGKDLPQKRKEQLHFSVKSILKTAKNLQSKKN